MTDYNTNSILGQSLRQKKFLENFQNPDTDSRILTLTGTDVTPDLMHDHTFMNYLVPVANSTTVTVNNPVNKEERSLHVLVLDNAFSGVSKTFNFAADYIFLDDEVSTFTLAPGEKKVWYGAIINGELYLRISVETI